MHDEALDIISDVAKTVHNDFQGVLNVRLIEHHSYANCKSLQQVQRDERHAEQYHERHFNGYA